MRVCWCLSTILAKGRSDCASICSRILIPILSVEPQSHQGFSMSRLKSQGSLSLPRTQRRAFSSLSLRVTLGAVTVQLWDTLARSCTWAMKPLVNRHEMDCHHPWPRSADSCKENPKVSQLLWARKVQKKPGRLITYCWSISWPGQIVSVSKLRSLFEPEAWRSVNIPISKLHFNRSGVGVWRDVSGAMSMHSFKGPLWFKPTH